MLEILSNLIKNKRVLVLGYGMEGRSSYKLLCEVGGFAELHIADVNPPKDVPDCKVISGAEYLDAIDDYDITFKSPGIALPRNHSEYKSKITSQTEVFLQAYRKQVIGITGTKGKSTVSSLLYHVLSKNNVPCIFAGNIGKPVFDIVSMIEPETTVVLELSCHQLDYCGFSPGAAVYLNLYQDHLDYYGTFEKYAATKKNIYLHQEQSDVLYCTEGVKPGTQENRPPVFQSECVSKIITVDETILPFKSFDELQGVRLHGKHNLVNAAFVYSIAKTYGVADDKFVSALQSYTPLRHRLEFVGKVNGVDYYDDSISTTVESAISAIEGISNASTILLGGMDRGIDYTKLINFLPDCKITNIVCMYESGKRVFELCKESVGFANKNKDLSYHEDIYKAVEYAKKVSQAGSACLLSPASASYGDFKNFEERGDVFQELINKEE